MLKDIGREGISSLATAGNSLIDQIPEGSGFKKSRGRPRKIQGDGLLTNLLAAAAKGGGDRRGGRRPL